MRVATVSSWRVSSLMPAFSVSRRTRTSGSSISSSSGCRPRSCDLRALAVGELVDQDGGGGEVVAGVGGDPALLGELVERVAAAGRVEQVAGDRGVEDEVRRDLGERLGVVGDDGAVAGGLDDQGRVVGLPASAMLPPA